MLRPWQNHYDVSSLSTDIYRAVNSEEKSKAENLSSRGTSKKERKPLSENTNDLKEMASLHGTKKEASVKLKN